MRHSIMFRTSLVPTIRKSLLLLYFASFLRRSAEPADGVSMTGNESIIVLQIA